MREIKYGQMQLKDAICDIFVHTMRYNIIIYVIKYCIVSYIMTRYIIIIYFTTSLFLHFLIQLFYIIKMMLL